MCRTGPIIGITICLSVPALAQDEHYPFVPDSGISIPGMPTIPSIQDDFRINPPNTDRFGANSNILRQQQPQRHWRHLADDAMRGMPGHPPGNANRM